MKDKLLKMDYAKDGFENLFMGWNSQQKNGCFADFTNVCISKTSKERSEMFFVNSLVELAEEQTK